MSTKSMNALLNDSPPESWVVERSDEARLTPRQFADRVIRRSLDELRDKQGRPKKAEGVR